MTYEPIVIYQGYYLMRNNITDDSSSINLYFLPQETNDDSDMLFLIFPSIIKPGSYLMVMIANIGTKSSNIRPLHNKKMYDAIYFFYSCSQFPKQIQYIKTFLVYIYV